MSVSQFHQRKQEPKKPKPSTACLGLVYVAIVIGVAYFLAGLVMEQVDLYDVLGLNDIEIPVINTPGREIPTWALQAGLAIIFFFILQPLVFLVTALLSPKKKEDDFYRPNQR
jgi:TRAP-type C4-dicarboxylate transport system permease small subunit